MDNRDTPLTYLQAFEEMLDIIHKYCANDSEMSSLLSNLADLYWNRGYSMGLSPEELIYFVISEIKQRLGLKYL